ncbi:MAG TPA: AraC family transcriptional regulator [Solirubrobacteraceae bacterium]|nr:AraC family transcriptional regulator [Solirubrobacteraceae bacterium]
MAVGSRLPCASRTSVVACESPAGRLTRASAPADPRLEGIVARDLVGVALDCAAPASWLQPPVAAVTVIVSLRDPVRTQAGELPDDWLGGIGVTHDIVEMPRHHASLDVKLDPLGAYAVLGRPVSELAGGCVSLRDLFGPAGVELGDRVRDAPDWAARFELIQTFLLRRAAAGPRPTPVVARAWSLLRGSDGRLAIGELADTVGASRRYLAARFREEVGLGPKQAARVLRFADVRRRLEADPAGFADIAQACGYCDQAHLNRDFRELAGTTPGAFVARQATPAGRS